MQLTDEGKYVVEPSVEELVALSAQYPQYPIQYLKIYKSLQGEYYIKCSRVETSINGYTFRLIIETNNKINENVVLVNNTFYFETEGGDGGVKSRTIDLHYSDVLDVKRRLHVRENINNSYFLDLLLSNIKLELSIFDMHHLRLPDKVKSRNYDLASWDRLLSSLAYPFSHNFYENLPVDIFINVNCINTNNMFSTIRAEFISKANPELSLRQYVTNYLEFIGECVNKLKMYYTTDPLETYMLHKIITTIQDNDARKKDKESNITKKGNIKEEVRQVRLKNLTKNVGSTSAWSSPFLGHYIQIPEV